MTSSPSCISLAMATSSVRSHCRNADNRSARRQVCGKRAISCASAIARARASPFATRRLASPIRSASAPPTGRPVRIRSIACEWPMRRGRRIVPRSISGTPKRRQKMPKVASCATTRKSAHSASSMPPATAKPSIAAITGFNRRNRLGPIGAMELCPPTSRFLLASPAATAFKSAPAQKVLPVPVKTATEASLSASKARKASYSLRAVKPSTALRTSGRLMEIMVTGPSRSTSTVSACCIFLPPCCCSCLVMALRLGTCHRARFSRGPAGAAREQESWLYLRLATRDSPIGLEIALARGLDHGLRQGRRRGFAVPAAGASLDVEIVAQGLLVEACLRPAGYVVIDRPETRGVGGHHLVDQDDAALAVAAELEFGVGNDDAV